jgi:pimeloyl-ACP methyl ester carboxylesterase
MRTRSIFKIAINGSWQWVLVSGRRDAPLLLQVQAGPGFPMIPEARTMERLLQLEEEWLVVYWDQRGVGRSFSTDLDAKTLHFEQFTADLIALTRQLLEKFGKRNLTVIGYSMGATLALMAAAKESALFSQLFLVGVDIDLPAAGEYTRRFLSEKAAESGNRRWMRQVQTLNLSPVLDSKAFQKRAKLLTDLGGINTRTSYNKLMISSIMNMLRSREYRLGDILKTMKGMEFVQNALLPEFDRLNLFATIKKVNVPVHFIQGKKDGIAPFGIAVKYFDFLDAPTKTFTAFEASAHMPHYEEPQKFAALIGEKITKGKG